VAEPVAPWSEDVLPELARRAAARPLIVLDDDPTGTQTLRDVTVLTEWNAGSIARHLDETVLFLSTNSRAFAEPAAAELTRSAANAARDASTAVGRSISFVSRSDSTLRGHFPAETLAVGGADARVLLAPYFGEGGRLTVGDVHVLQRDGHRVNVADTEFARDPTFGYRSRDLRGWVSERYGVAGLPAPAVSSLPLSLVRGSGPEGVAAALLDLPPGAVAIANAAEDRDIEVTALGAVIAEEAGLPLVARTAASYVRARAGRAPAPPLAAHELATRGPGLVIVGSHVELTTRQLTILRRDAAAGRLEEVELAVEPLVAGGAGARAAVVRAAERLDGALGEGRIAVLSTERTWRGVGVDGGRAIAAGLVNIVQRIRTRPGWVVAKGGITSHEIARGALGMREARVAGQLLPGVPVWIGAEGSRWPGVPLVVFPGNVGDEAALLRAVELLEAT
jgi:uncharacterized protein YgbK (DUF1537 family)